MTSNYRLVPFYPLIRLTYLTMTNGGVGWSRLPVFCAFILRFTLLEPFRLLELLLFERKIQRHQITQAPIFVLGHWRSGTTRLQELLATDHNHATTSIYQFLFIDHFILSEKLMKRPINWLVSKLGLPYSFQRVKMDMDMAGELETGMCSLLSQYSSTWGHIFPKRYLHWTKRMIGLENEKDAQGWLNDYEYLIRKMSYTNGGKRIIVKSPGDTARISHLLERFPDAKFVYISRSSNDVYHSNLYLWKVIQKEASLNWVSDERIHQYILSSYNLLLDTYKKTKESLRRNQLAEVTFKELIKSPENTLDRIYKKLELPTFSTEKDKVSESAKITPNKSVYPADEKLLKLLKEAWHSNWID